MWILKQIQAQLKLCLNFLANPFSPSTVEASTIINWTLYTRCLYVTVCQQWRRALADSDLKMRRHSSGCNINTLRIKRAQARHFATHLLFISQSFCARGDSLVYQQLLCADISNSLQLTREARLKRKLLCFKAVRNSLFRAKYFLRAQFVGQSVHAYQRDLKGFGIRKHTINT